jgi:hypothetical protein
MVHWACSSHPPVEAGEELLGLAVHLAHGFDAVEELVELAGELLR